MTTELDSIIAEVNKVFIDVLDDEDVEIGYDSTADDVDDWDSLTHIQLIVALENHFKIKFTSLEIQGYANVGQMCEAIVRKRNDS